MTTAGRPGSPIRAGRELARGSAWMIGMRWAIRGVGLVSTVILARLLAPDDFGVVAMAMVAVAILQSFTQSGTDLALLRNTKATHEHYDTAWTLEIIQSVLLAVVLFATAPLVGGHFEDPRVTEVVRILSLRALFGGFQNIGVVNFRRDLQFGQEFRSVAAQLLGASHRTGPRPADRSRHQLPDVRLPATPHTGTHRRDLELLAVAGPGALRAPCE
jgi:O-antigen/teichoic acid export membrane protein